MTFVVHITGTDKVLLRMRQNGLSDREGVSQSLEAPNVIAEQIRPYMHKITPRTAMSAKFPVTPNCSRTSIAQFEIREFAYTQVTQSMFHLATANL